MIIEELHIENFKLFKNIDFELDDNFTLVIGSNGVGKTTFLEAVSVALGGFLVGFDGVQSRNILTDEIRQEWDKVGDATVTPVSQLPVVIECKSIIDGLEVGWKRTRNREEYGKTSRIYAKQIIDYANDLQSRIREKDHSVILPIVSYHSAGRLFSQKKNKWHDPFKKDVLSRFLGYTDCLDAESNIKLFVNWLRRMTTIQLQKGKFVGELNSVLQAIELFMSELIGGQSEISLFYDFEEEEVMVEINDSIQPLRFMSSGYRSVIGMVADIAYRMSLLNPQMRGNAALTPGVVLIDEIDLHLHPRWQWRIIDALRITFPNVQFIATTHAPIVISSCENGKIISLEQKGETIESIDTSPPYGWLVEDILTDIMETNARDPEMEQKIEEVESLYRKSIDSELDKVEVSKLSKLIKELYRYLPSGDPAVTMAKVQAIGKKSMGDNND